MANGNSPKNDLKAAMIEKAHNLIDYYRLPENIEELNALVELKVSLGPNDEPILVRARTNDPELAGVATFEERLVEAYETVRAADDVIDMRPDASDEPIHLLAETPLDYRMSVISEVTFHASSVFSKRLSVRPLRAHIGEDGGPITVDGAMAGHGSKFMFSDGAPTGGFEFADDDSEVRWLVEKSREQNGKTSNQE